MVAKDPLTLFQGDVERAVPAFRVADSVGSSRETPLVKGPPLVGIPRRRFPVEDVVGFLGAAGHRERGLRREDVVPHLPEHRPHPALFGLGLFLAVTGLVALEKGPEAGHHRRGLLDQPPPIVARRERLVEIVVREKPVVAVCLSGQRRLHGHSHRKITLPPESSCPCKSSAEFSRHPSSRRHTRVPVDPAAPYR